ncbi:hypothetical protein SKAU_G00128940 [Synaphobranchus kaupii]|uniref:Uncharacterized protein n=1 Tax=Synaphobranchus kaupii TaxID=118154 RepID=A0A9Q1FQ65_SYNKA|nr:hypothetical protein SKAU_G00128940 [Synaphobranchus kaupii]
MGQHTEGELQKPGSKDPAFLFPLVKWFMTGETLLIQWKARAHRSRTLPPVFSSPLKDETIVDKQGPTQPCGRHRGASEDPCREKGMSLQMRAAHIAFAARGAGG